MAEINRKVSKLFNKYHKKLVGYTVWSPGYDLKG
jgi:hypothetical protein